MNNDSHATRRANMFDSIVITAAEIVPSSGTAILLIFTGCFGIFLYDQEIVRTLLANSIGQYSAAISSALGGSLLVTSLYYLV